MSKVTGGVLMVLLSCSAYRAYGQNASSSAAKRAEYSIQLENPDRQARLEAFYALWEDPLTDKHSDEGKLKFIRLLEREDSFRQQYIKEFEQTGGTVGEEYTEYYANLIQAVISLQDARSLDALLGALTTGDMVTQALAGLGAAAIDPVVHNLESADAEARQCATIVLREMLEPKNAAKISDPVSRDRMKKGLIEAANDGTFGCEWQQLKDWSN